MGRFHLCVGDILVHMEMLEQSLVYLFALHKQPDTLLTLEDFLWKLHLFSNIDVYSHPSPKLWSIVSQLTGTLVDMGNVWSDN